MLAESALWLHRTTKVIGHSTMQVSRLILIRIAVERAESTCITVQVCCCTVRTQY